MCQFLRTDPPAEPQAKVDECVAPSWQQLAIQAAKARQNLSPSATELHRGVELFDRCSQRPTETASEGPIRVVF